MSEPQAVRKEPCARKKICYLADAASIHTQRWVRYFADQGHEVHLISLNPTGETLPNVHLHTLKVVRGIGPRQFPARVRSALRGFNLASVMIQVSRTISQLAPDVVHAHSVSDNGFMGALSGFHPLILTAWGSDILVAPQRSKLLKWAVRFALARADYITCDAQHLVERMVELGARREKIGIIYFGTDTRRFAPDRRDARLKEQLHLDAAAPLVISLRNLTPLYDVESLIKAAPIVLGQIPQTRFIIAGGGDQRSYLESLAAAWGVAEQVLFVGPIPAGDLPRYLASADVYVSTSLSDAGLAASTAEAMACGLPVVITDFGDNRQWVKDGEGGFLIPLKDPAVLAEKIIHLLKDADLRARWGQINRSVIEEQNSYHKEMAKVERIYQQLAKEHKS